MSKKNVIVEIVSHYQNGFEDDVKFVEVDGQKYVADATDPTKPAVDDKGAKVPFVAKDDKGGEDKGGKGGSLEELAKTNPEIAKLLDDKKKLEDSTAKALADAAKAAEDKAEKDGEWKTLAEQRKADLEKAQSDLAQKEEILGKYVTSTKAILKDVMETIPAEKRGLIPENFSPREKLEYITKNAKVLGASVNTKGGGIPPNDGDPAPTDEAKLATEIETLRKKENKTSSDHTKIFELSKKLKEVRAAGQGK